MKKKSFGSKSLARRLKAYSVMAGAALVLMPSAEGEIVHADKYTMPAMPTIISDDLVQSQQLQPQRIRHIRHKGKGGRLRARMGGLGGKLRPMGNPSTCTTCSCTYSTSCSSTTTFSTLE